ncbi:RWD domain-containing protein [Glomus cerebriforme]|uniref:RWD domain-containing protein n=1 Tax=Glomus cerebriforme TaxID=658196 RepID=A0A397SXX8_9GLOM|nr:RWD domain-containing protein [Glomus cerebriforme]
MDHKEEQEQELEVLKSIYPDEFEEISEGEFRIRLEPEEQDSAAPLTLALHIKFTPTYPEEIPEISIETLDGSIEIDEHEKLYSELMNVAQDSLGMAMVFTLTSLLKDLLTSFVTERKDQRKKEEEDKIRKEIEAEQAKFQGTKVTVASFLEWKENYDKELEEKEKSTKSLATIKKDEAKKLKLTGRQLFEQDESLAKSDMTYLEEGDVTVDVSLFEREEDMSEEEEEDNSVIDLVRNIND